LAGQPGAEVNPFGGQPGAEQSYGEIFGEMGTALEGVSAEDIVKAVLPDLTDEKDVALLAITLGGAIGVPVIGGTPGAVASSGRGAYKAYKLLGGKLGPPLTKLVQKAYAQLKSGIGAAGRGGPNVQGSRRLASGRFGSAEALGGQRIQEGLGALGRGAGWSAQQFNPVKSLGGVGTKRVLGRTIPAIAAGTYGARRAFNEGVDAGELSDEQVLAEIAGVDPHQGARMAPFYQDVAEPEVADVTVDKPPVVPPAATAGISGLPGLPDYASYSAQLAELDKSPQQIRDNAITNALIELQLPEQKPPRYYRRLGAVRRVFERLDRRTCAINCLPSCSLSRRSTSRKFKDTERSRNAWAFKRNSEGWLGRISHIRRLPTKPTIHSLLKPPVVVL
jgi:hypothetical protein